MKKDDREIMEILEACDMTGCAHSAAQHAGVAPQAQSVVEVFGQGGARRIAASWSWTLGRTRRSPLRRPSQGVCAARRPAPDLRVVPCHRFGEVCTSLHSPPRS